MSSSYKVIASAIAGLAAGAAAGILLAPAEGRQSRKSLCNIIGELRYTLPANANTEIFRFTNWRRRLLARVIAPFLGWARSPNCPMTWSMGKLFRWN